MFLQKETKMDEYKSEIIISEENLAVYEEIHKQLEKIQKRTMSRKQT